MKTVSYSASEITIIKNCHEMGFKYSDVVTFLNKRYHNNNPVRTVEGIRKQVKK